jgi:transposase
MMAWWTPKLVSTRSGVDTSKQVLGGVRRWRRWPIEEKQRIVQETLEPGASVARTAQRYAVNANQIFKWRKEYREGRLGNNCASLLPVRVASEPVIEATKAEGLTSRSPLGRLEIQLGKGNLQITGAVDDEVSAGRAALDSLGHRIGISRVSRHNQRISPEGSRR